MLDPDPIVIVNRHTLKMKKCFKLAILCNTSMKVGEHSFILLLKSGNTSHTKDIPMSILIHRSNLLASRVLCPGPDYEVPDGTYSRIVTRSANQTNHTNWMSSLKLDRDLSQ